MKTQPRIFHYLLLLTLLAGQWLYATHSHGDEMHDAEHPCELCLHTAQLKAFLPVVALKPPAQAPRYILITQACEYHTTPHSRFHDPRAPPQA